MEFHTRTMDTLQRQGQGIFWIFALMRFLLLSIAFMSYKAGVDALVMRRNDAYYPADEYVTVNEGETLVMNCYASRSYLENVWWGKVITDTNTDWLTGNSYVHTDDSRVSVDFSTIGYQERYNNGYSIRITDVTTSDSGKYRCSVTWEGDSSRGFVFVTVNYFLHEDPLCSANEADASSVNDIDVRCDTADGNPQVNIIWTVQETGEEVSSSIHDHNLGGQARRLSQLRLRQELRNHILVCTVTSSAFPGQNRTCYVGPISAATHSSDVGISTGATASPPTLAVTDETQTGYIAAAVGIPAAFVVGILVSVACIRKRQQTIRKRSTDPLRETATPDAGHQPPDVEIAAIPYSVTTMPDDDVTGARVSVHAYETRIGPAEDTDSAAYEQVDRDIGENEVTSSYLELQ